MPCELIPQAREGPGSGGLEIGPSSPTSLAACWPLSSGPPCLDLRLCLHSMMRDQTLRKSLLVTLSARPAPSPQGLFVSLELVTEVPRLQSEIPLRQKLTDCVLCLQVKGTGLASLTRTRFTQSTEVARTLPSNPTMARPPTLGLLAAPTNHGKFTGTISVATDHRLG